MPAKLVHAPWTMRLLDQEASGCVIGRDYPAPVVDHARARAITLELYGRAVKGPPRAHGGCAPRRSC